MKYLILLLSFSAFADGGHSPTINNYYESITNTSNDSGIAVACASGQQNSNWAAKSWQGFAGVCHYGNADAAAFGVAKLFRGTKEGVLFTTNISSSEGKQAVSAGINWRF